MNSYLFGGVSALELVVPKMITVESATLVLLAATLLVFRTFRERYLLIWILGWVAYLVSVSTHTVLNNSNPHYELAISQASFVLALSLFAAGTLVYCHAHKALSRLLGFCALLLACTILREMLWSDSEILRAGFEIGYRLIPITAAIQLIRFRWARWEISSWMLSVSLLL